MLTYKTGAVIYTRNGRSVREKTTMYGYKILQTSFKGPENKTTDAENEPS